MRLEWREARFARLKPRLAKRPQVGAYNQEI